MQKGRNRSHHASRLAALIRDALHRKRRGHSDRFRWLGHKDGGALAMKTYGHLRREHSIAQAQRVTFAPMPMKQADVIAFPRVGVN